MAQDPRFLGIMFQVCLESGTSFHQGHPVQSPVIIEKITKASFHNRKPTKWAFFSRGWVLFTAEVGIHFMFPCHGFLYSQTPHRCFYLVLQNNNFLIKQTLSPADFRRILKLSQSMSSGILDTRSKLSSWQLQLSLTGQHCPECIEWGFLRSGQFSLSQKSNLHPAQQLVLKIIIFIPKTTICQFLSPVEPSTKPSWSSIILEE